jgi:hypothetical protein
MGLLASPKPGLPNGHYILRFDSINGAIVGEKDRRIAIDRLRLSLKVPVESRSTETAKVTPPFSYMDAGISTDLNFTEGQKVVVGKAGLGTPDEAVFLVLSAKIIE